MPELPDVEALRAMFEKHALARTIEEVVVREAKALQDATAQKLSEEAVGNHFSEVLRHGKMLFARIGDGPFLVFHFGMTGRLIITRADDDLPAHARLVFEFHNGGRLVFGDQRKLGWLELAGSMSAYLRDNEIGPDALSVSKDRLQKIIGATRGHVKPALMDQSKLAGIGNVYSDEILLQASLRPDAKGNALSDGQLRQLHRVMREVLETASHRLSEGKGLPDDWLTPHRGQDGHCPRCGADLAHEKTSGRTAWFCPACQRDADG
ncbi:MAG: DNA-formamidopyrimidine glycosylase family protein [Roseovarius sp.]